MGPALFFVVEVDAVVDSGHEPATLEAARDRLRVAVADEDDRARLRPVAGRIARRHCGPSSCEASRAPGRNVRSRPPRRSCSRARRRWLVLRAGERFRAARHRRGEGGPADGFDRVFVYGWNGGRMEVGDGHEWERDGGGNSGGDTYHDPESEPRRLSRSQSFFGDDRSGAEQREQQSHRVIRFATGDEHRREQGQVGEPEWSKRSGRRAAQKPPESRDPERREERADQQQLQGKQLGSVAGWILGADLAGELQLWPPVPCLPEEVRASRERGPARPLPITTGCVPDRRGERRGSRRRARRAGASTRCLF